jgi:hypothetical protein
MKAIWTILFVAVAAAILGITMLLVPDTSRTDKFWLSMGGMGFGLLALYIAFTFKPAPMGEQGGSVMRGTLAFGSFFYFFVTIALALVAVTGIEFKWLAVLHILALLAWVVVTCFGALGATAMAKVDRGGQ